MVTASDFLKNYGGLGIRSPYSLKNVYFACTLGLLVMGMEGSLPVGRMWLLAFFAINIPLHFKTIKTWFTHGKERRFGKEEQKLIKIKLLLIKDFEELDKGELQVLRNYTREVYHIAGEIKLGVDELLNAYLIFKRKFITTLETVAVCPYPMVEAGGSFVAAQTTYAPIAVTTFDGVFSSSKETFTINEWQSLPVLTVFYFDDRTEVCCLAPNGHFCRITSKILQFDI